jgi:hypothetical protein
VELLKIWHANPDMRLGQLLVNGCDELDGDLFYIEDAELIDSLRASKHLKHP